MGDGWCTFAIKRPIVSSNFLVGRPGNLVKAIVLHVADGPLSAVFPTFNDPDHNVSAHFCVGKAGEIEQYVSINDTAYGNGLRWSPSTGAQGGQWLNARGKPVNPTWIDLEPKVNPNLYCVTPETRILTPDFQWRPAGDFRIGDPILGFDEEIQLFGHRRKLLDAEVIGTGIQLADVYRIELSDGTVLHSTGEHRWLARKAKGHPHQWLRTDVMEEVKKRRKDKLLIPRFFNVYNPKQSYRAGFLAAAFDGEGALRHHVNKSVFQLQFAQKDNQMLEMVEQYLKEEGFSYRKQFAEPSEVWSLILQGGRDEVLRFLMECRSPRLIGVWSKLRRDFFALSAINDVQVVCIKAAGTREIVALGSSCHTYIAEGFGAHNTISVEHEGKPDDEWTDEMYTANNRLLIWIAEEMNMTYVPHRTLIGHHELDPVDRARCPGPRVEYEIIARDANNGVPLPATDLIAKTVLAKSKSFHWLPINTDAALYKFAQEKSLGYPQTDEFEVNHNNNSYVAQVFNLGIVYAKKNDYGNVMWVEKPSEV